MVPNDDRVVKITLVWAVDGVAMLKVVLRGETEWLHFKDIFLEDGDSVEFLDGQDKTTWADRVVIPREAVACG